MRRALSLPGIPPPNRCSCLTWCQGCNPGRDGLGDRRGLFRLPLHFPRLRLSQGPAQGLHLSLEGAIALPGQPELEVHPWVGLPQQHLEQEGARELVAQPPLSSAPPHLTDPSVPPVPRPKLSTPAHLQQQLLGGGPGRLQSLLQAGTAGVNHAGARGLIDARLAEHPVTVKHVVPITGHQRCKESVSLCSREPPAPKPKPQFPQRPGVTQMVVAALCYADVPGALGDQSHVPVAGEGT